MIFSEVGLRHVVDGDALGDAHHEGDACVGGFHDGIGGERRRDEDHAHVGPGLLDSLGDGVVDRTVEVRRAALARRHARDDVGAVAEHLLGVEAALLASDALDDEAGILVYEDAHVERRGAWIELTALDGKRF